MYFQKCTAQFLDTEYAIQTVNLHNAMIRDYDDYANMLAAERHKHDCGESIVSQVVGGAYVFDGLASSR